MQTSAGNDLIWFESAAEKAVFDRLGLACVYAVGAQGTRDVKIGWACNLQRRLHELQVGNPRRLEPITVSWTPGTLVVKRLEHRVREIVRPRSDERMPGWFDLPWDAVPGLFERAVRETGIPVIDHDEMLRRVGLARSGMVSASAARGGSPLRAAEIEALFFTQAA